MGGGTKGRRKEEGGGRRRWRRWRRNGREDEEGEEQEARPMVLLLFISMQINNIRTIINQSFLLQQLKRKVPHTLIDTKIIIIWLWSVYLT